MADGKFVSYLRVSTKTQGASGLGLEAQRAAVAGFLNGGRWSVIREVVEVESGKRADRPKLAEALSLCRLHGATLLVAKLDRLSRNAAFLFNLRDAGVKFIAADMPEANEMTVGIMAVVAEGERKAISKRTTEALAAAKVRLANLTEEERAERVATRQGREARRGPVGSSPGRGCRSRACGRHRHPSRQGLEPRGRSPADHRRPAGIRCGDIGGAGGGPDRAWHPDCARGCRVDTHAGQQGVEGGLSYGVRYGYT